jgi:small subunit ribosomal protein S4
MRYTGPTTRINRKYKQAIFPLTKAYERKPYLPGIHGPKLRRKVNDYSTGLNEKQKLRFMFGLTESQLRLTFERAKKMKGVTGHVLLQLLETRLDSVVYSLGFAKTRKAARQLVFHGHVRVNGKKVNIPSRTCKPGDEIHVKEKITSRQLVTRCLDETQFRATPPWMTVIPESLKGIVNRLPVRDEMVKDIDDQRIIEFYRR